MINADRVLAELQQRNERTLSAIFGKRYEEMSEEAKGAANEVLMWSEGLSTMHDKAIEAIQMRDSTIKAIKRVVADYAGESVLHSALHNSQRRDAADLRAMMYRMLYELTNIPKSGLAKALGTGQNHSTVHIALRRADDLHLVDKRFRETYDTLIKRVRAMLEANKEG